MIVGVNGGGKTTSLGKGANFCKALGIPSYQWLENQSMWEEEKLLYVCSSSAISPRSVFLKIWGLP